LTETTSNIKIKDNVKCKKWKL